MNSRYSKLGRQTPTNRRLLCRSQGPLKPTRVLDKVDSISLPHDYETAELVSRCISQAGGSRGTHVACCTFTDVQLPRTGIIYAGS
jgi:hypothetical protein